MTKRQEEKKTNTAGGIAEAVSPERLAELVLLAGDDDPDWLKELVEQFAEDTIVRLGALDMLTGRQQNIDDAAAEIRSIAHILKGSCRNIGADPMADMCQTLQQAAEDGALDDVREQRDRLRSEFKRVIILLSVYSPGLTYE